MKERKMKQVTITDVRYHFPKVERLLRRGEVLQVTRRNKIATLIPASLMTEEEKKQASNAERI